MSILPALLKKAAKRILPYSPAHGVRPLPVPEAGQEREGVSFRQIFPPASFDFPGYTSLSGEEDFPPYRAETPPYRLFTLKKGIFIFGREEAFSRRGRIVEEMTAQKTNPLKGKKLRLRPTRRVRGRVLLLGMSGLENGYYHFVVELLLRWWIFRQGGQEADYYAFSTEKPFQKDALALLGIRGDQMLSAEEGTVIRADCLLCPSLVNNFTLAHLRGWELYNKIFMPPWSASAYRYLLGSSRTGGGSPGEQGALLYISRNRSARRRIENEDELLAVLKQHGFRTCYLEELGLGEQIALFASARMVVAPHGAGLANLAWSREGTAVLELYPEFYHDPSFRILSAAHRLDYHYVICKSPGADSLHPAEENILLDSGTLALIDDFIGSFLMAGH